MKIKRCQYITLRKNLVMLTNSRFTIDKLKKNTQINVIKV